MLDTRINGNLDIDNFSEYLNKGIHELFYEQVVMNPERVAISCLGKSLTYMEVHQITENLANHLVGKGAGVEKIVAVCVERSLDLVLILLSVLKSGSAYLFIEPNTPTDRISYIVNDISPVLLITAEEFPVIIPECNVDILQLSMDWKTSISGKQRSEIEINPDNLAYVSYTSGTTGVPKGVSIPHKGVVRLVKGWGKVNTDDVFLQVSSSAFDASTLEIWSPLCNGGRCAVYGPGQVSPDRLAETMVNEQVTTGWFTSGLFNVMVDNHLCAFSELKHVIAGGDVLSPTHVTKLLNAYPNIYFTNGYGPTENTTFTTTWTINQHHPEDKVPIGKPIKGSDVIILDDNLELVPDNVIGELYAFGEGLARCYVNKPAETAQKFLPNPFGRPGERMYKTGDLAIRREDGVIEFLGRKDQQVKIRGYRVEISEIEITLSAHPEVNNVVVEVQKDMIRGNILIAYIVVDRNTGDHVRLITELREYLKSKLPYFMIPWAIIPLDEIPLSNNGKINRKELPVNLRTPRGLKVEYVEPRNELELELARIWGDLLLKEPIGINDDFFDLGGHSLLAAELLLQIQNVLGIQIPARILYFNSTISELASEVKKTKLEVLANANE
ncbi:amino acid adenylation domain-containing protein [Fontibacillus panacisegetis]|uniref:Amino acid adenylation domain-containing protein n=1 Tax=Fontibacillus panacisegetis TaxID=670482 RepID=A0A1G7HGY1_9BACL|nr:non-ribosomal peptide synthetase [Fontibacillus panacisegetis]SDE99573.1 amino acid adenylation domain-containing protein [Fontibacillus panacisegetis]